MKIRTLLLVIFFAVIIAHALIPYQHNHYGWYVEDMMLFTPTVTDLHIPTAIDNHGSYFYKKMDGSGLSMLLPDGYEMCPDFKGCYWDRDTSVRVSEDEVGFPKFSKTIDAQLASLTKYAKGDVTLLYKRNFTFNNYAATALYLYEESSRHTYVYMAFGDEGFHVTMQGTCRASDLANRDKILHAMLTSVYDGHHYNM